jgi:hypothetical protein
MSTTQLYLIPIVQLFSFVFQVFFIYLQLITGSRHINVFNPALTNLIKSTVGLQDRPSLPHVHPLNSTYFIQFRSTTAQAFFKSTTQLYLNSTVLPYLMPTTQFCRHVQSPDLSDVYRSALPHVYNPTLSYPHPLLQWWSAYEQRHLVLETGYTECGRVEIWIWTRLRT